MGKHDNPADKDSQGGKGGKPGPMKDPAKGNQGGKHGDGKKGK